MYMNPQAGQSKFPVSHSFQTLKYKKSLLCLGLSDEISKANTGDFCMCRFPVRRSYSIAKALW